MSLWAKQPRGILVLTLAAPAAAVRSRPSTVAWGWLPIAGSSTVLTHLTNLEMAWNQGLLRPCCVCSTPNSPAEEMQDTHTHDMLQNGLNHG